jgi:hypothetical protein
VILAEHPMKTVIGTVLLAGLPALAQAQTQTQVPAIVQGSAAAEASVVSGLSRSSGSEDWGTDGSPAPLLVLGAITVSFKG